MTEQRQDTQEPEIVPSGETPEAPDLALALQLPPAIARRLEKNDALDPQKKFTQTLKLLESLRPAALALTKNQDWVKMGRIAYLQSTGAERLAPLYGIVFGQKMFTLENFDDGTFAYTCEMAVYSQATGILYGTVEGGRWSGDQFFSRFDEDLPPEIENGPTAALEAWKKEHRRPCNPLNVKKAAATNCEIRAVSKIAGLRNLTPEDLKPYGIEVFGFSYGKGTKGGTAQEKTEEGVVVVPFGYNKGTPITELDEKELVKLVTYMTKRLEGSDYQPGGSKHKYRANEERLRNALNDEIKRRVDAEVGAPAESEKPGP